MPYEASPSRYQTMQYRYCGQSGLQLPALSLGLWHSFGGVSSLESQRELLRTAFDLGITHFDLAKQLWATSRLGGRELWPPAEAGF
ncbi:L-glyceraldehyde 3-phosphate reductase [Cedecea lapagei]|uniref:L-glyceraldehyde 3-phosphate reductase n=1 Tax=Cedecea lapagei TaxID=158823 RepID=A0A3S4J0M0_9ENTR|nr:L-glyceraldehyde 3-phosphate reductase [Cedecea lapagei]